MELYGILSTVDSKVLTQGTLQNPTTNTVCPKRCGDEEMHAEGDLGGNRAPSLAAEVVSDSSLKKTSGETEDVIGTKESSEQREMETAILHPEDNLATEKHSGLCYIQVFTKIMKPMFYVFYFIGEQRLINNTN